MNNEVLNAVIDDYKTLYHIEKGKRKEQQQELDKYKNIVDVKTNYIEELLLCIAKSNDYKIQKEVYEKGLEYDKKLKELKGE